MLYSSFRSKLKFMTGLACEPALQCFFFTFDFLAWEGKEIGDLTFSPPATKESSMPKNQIFKRDKHQRAGTQAMTDLCHDNS